MTITERERDDFSQQHQEHFYYDAMYCLSGVKMALVTLLLLLCPVTCNGTCWASLTCCSIATDWGLKAPSGRKPTHSKDAKSDSSLLFYPKKMLAKKIKRVLQSQGLLSTYIYSFSAHTDQMMLAPLSLNHLRHVQKNNAWTHCLKKVSKSLLLQHSVFYEKSRQIEARSVLSRNFD